MKMVDAPTTTPLERVEALYRELVAWYGEGSEREIRAASKLLVVALFELKTHGGPGWRTLVDDLIQTLERDPARFERMLEAHRGEQRRPW
ncbi:hypothetical protein ABC977_03835 [Thioalkalicoccus limnaeus]|uniref:DUF2164 domain-containing protein n=1 Tax=Thioalkalicoccus limnaeus TaxID=120681 RepID=A0ABV4BB11_9GAMM